MQPKNYGGHNDYITGGKKNGATARAPPIEEKKQTAIYFNDKESQSTPVKGGKKQALFIQDESAAVTPARRRVPDKVDPINNSQCKSKTNEGISKDHGREVFDQKQEALQQNKLLVSQQMF